MILSLAFLIQMAALPDPTIEIKQFEGESTVLRTAKIHFTITRSWIEQAADQSQPVSKAEKFCQGTTEIALNQVDFEKPGQPASILIKCRGLSPKSQTVNLAAALVIVPPFETIPESPQKQLMSFMYITSADEEPAELGDTLSATANTDELSTQWLSVYYGSWARVVGQERYYVALRVEDALASRDDSIKK